MVFEEKIKEIDFKTVTETVKVRIDIEPKRENKLQIMKEVYSDNIRPISRTKLLKMAIDNLIRDVEALTEEEGLEYLRNIYKEAEF